MVKMVKVADAAFVPVMLNGLVVPKLNVGKSEAPLGLVVMEAANVTLPVKPPTGVTVMVEVFPVVAPGVTATDVPVSVKLGAGKLMV